ncbi:hypothetical protein OAO01_01340 [Oligoflexia bacterium]|nr:hypothetical protein [Oligoflexia bacterium]
MLGDDNPEIARPNCAQCGASFAIFQSEQPTYDAFDIPQPELCFDCRFQHRLAFYNRRSLYRRTCDFTGKPIVSIFSPDKPFKVYEKDVWQSDQWNALEYGRDFDFKRPFFEQFRELIEDVPAQALTILGKNENSEFTNDNLRMKDCYLVFDADNAQGVMYAETLVGVRDSLDLLACTNLELSYECVGCEDSYGLKYSRYCKNCSDAWFLSDCIGCRNCFGCVNLHQKEHHIYNEAYSRKDYENFMQSFQSSSYQEIQNYTKAFDKFYLTQPLRSQRGTQNQNVSGAYLSNCKNAHYCFNGRNIEDCHYCTDILLPAHNCMDVHIWGDGIQLVYNSAVIGDKCFNILCSYYVASGCSDVAYSFYCIRGCSDLFGCAALQRAKYCILNKEYSKEDYEELRTRIVAHMRETGEWGKFFPPTISPFGYNETLAPLYFPLEQDEVLQRGWKWSDYDAPVAAKKTIPSSELPDDARDVDDSILEHAILCEVSGRPFKLVTHELNFYKTHKLPLPRRHPDQRHLDRFQLKFPYRLWERECQQCQAPLLCNYAPDRPEILYCTECYQKHVF